MGAKISANGRLYANRGRIVFVSSGKDCPRINATYIAKEVRFKDDFSKGFKVSKTIAKLLF
ncbi:MAG: hypothetical protein ACREBJ_10550 [Nitrosotalea sp.]